MRTFKQLLAICALLTSTQAGITDMFASQANDGLIELDMDIRQQPGYTPGVANHLMSLVQEPADKDYIEKQLHTYFNI